MKNIIIVFLALFLFGTNNSMIAQSKKMDAFTVKVDGLGCSFCAFGLEKKFKEFKGIKKMQIDIETGVLKFEYPKDKNLSIAEVQNKVDKAGYTPVRVSIKRANGKVEKTDNIVKATKKDFKTIKFSVAGTCGMCKVRIEKAAKSIDGVQEATWDVESQQLTVKLNSNISQEDVESTIAKVGHDTKNVRAEDEVYDNLHGCCKYDRL